MPIKFDLHMFPNGALQASHIPGTDKWIIARNFHYVARSGVEYVAVAETVINGYSLPWILRGLFQRVRKIPEGPALHDPAYGDSLYVLTDGRLLKAHLTRKESDQLLREIMQRMGASKLLYESTYYGLRVFGRGHFHE